jgi:hypothetical protein
MNPPGTIGINEAARLTGKNKAIIHRDAEANKLPFTKNDKGHRAFQVADLLACYGPFKPLAGDETGDETGSGHRKSPEQETNVTSGLTVALDAKDQLIDALKAQIEDLRQERDRWHTAYEQKLLPAPAQPAANTNLPVVTEPPHSKPTWFQRLTGRATA